jgi:hypothetical protein
MSDSPDLPEPLFAHDEPGPRFAVGDIANMLAATGVPWSAASARIRSYAAKRLVHTREKGSGATSARLFALADVATAKVLSNLQDCGVADVEILRAASLVCYGWPAGVKPTATHPVLAALAGVGRGEWWVFHLDAYRHDQTHERRFAGALHPDSEAPVWTIGGDMQDPASGWRPAGGFLSVLNPDFLPILRDRTKAN